MVARFKDWYTFPKESGLARFDSWFHEVVKALRGHINDAYWESSDGSALTFDRTHTSSETRIVDNYNTDTGGAVQWHLNGTRLEYISDTVHLWYTDDGGTEIGRLQLDDGYMRIKRIENGDLTINTTHFANYGTGDAYAKYYMDSDGFVHIQGRLSKVSSGTLASGSLVATVPSGFRPDKRHTFSGRTSQGGGGDVQINVQADGQILFYHAGAPATGLAQGYWVSIDCCYHVGH